MEDCSLLFMKSGGKLVGMSRYREIADTLRDRIQAGQYPVGSLLPSTSALMEEFATSSSGTISAVHQVLEEQGMVERRQGVGVLVVSTTSLRQVNVLDTVATARDALNTAIAALTAPNRRVVIDLDERDDTYFVLETALRDWAAQQRFEAEGEPEEDTTRLSRLRWAEEAERLAQLVDDKF